MSRAGSTGLTRRQIMAGTAATLAGIGIQWSVGTKASALAQDGVYVLRFEEAPDQLIEGLGVEIQSDSIGSANNGLPASTSSVPFDLTPSERDRFVSQMLMAGRVDGGFRYLRLALGLYFRGLDSESKHVIERFPGQAAGLAALIRDAKMEGVSAEYWSPAPAWKTTNSYIGGTIKSTEPAFLDEMAAAMAQDVRYLIANGIPVAQWGMQNEPIYNNSQYSQCKYSGEQYYQLFKRVAPLIHGIDPGILISVDSMDGWNSAGGVRIKSDPAATAHVDAWSYHRIGLNSNYQMDNDFNQSASLGKPVFTNEFEYLTGQTPNMLNTAQSIMNWFTFVKSPTWYWLHALKPTTNSESYGYGLGFWRPPHDTDFSANHFPDLPVGHWQFNPVNWNGVSGFVKFLPKNSRRHIVTEPQRLYDQRIMAWKTPTGKAVFAVTNRGTTPFTFNVDTQNPVIFRGYQYTATVPDASGIGVVQLGAKNGPSFSTTVPSGALQFWVADA
ncbi:hypothetical protein [Paenarthrobacter sp. A20]|uniref:hypothetical protein n=1 Tax=Paenarthrobacter sp. A20 TaxID=2817891 RepID=UPI0020A070A7|nr:hypothetical protein [Paenarthrobacter sp. A20]MCP1415745.1 O-glycosyl hydrolase [Paenarthrobacter sp. A20]